jgi:hypothetical protein
MAPKRTRNSNKNRNNTTKKKKININFESIHYNNIDYIYIKSPEFNKPSGPLRAVVLDNDETTGVFLALKKLVENSEKENYSEFIHEATELLTRPEKGRAAFRNGIETFLQKLYELKKQDKIDAVIMYTNMTVSPFLTIQGNIYTRPQILSDIFDTILKETYGTIDKPLCDLIIFRQIAFPPQKYIKVIEEIYDIHNKNNKFVFFDDKPENILNTNSSIKSSNSAYGIIEYKGRNTNKSFYNSYTSKGIKNKSVFEVLDSVFS